MNLEAIVEATPLGEITLEQVWLPASSTPIARSRAVVHRALRLGILERQPCERCGGNSQIEAHHPNYYRPLLVTWLCRKCHKAEHSRLYRAGIKIPGEPENRYMRQVPK